MGLVDGRLRITSWGTAAVVLIASSLLAVTVPRSNADLGPVCLIRTPAEPGFDSGCPERLLFEAQTAFAPKALPPSRRVPIGFHFESKVSVEGGGHPPALREGVFDLDRRVTIDASEFRACPRKYVAHGGIARALKLCSDSIVGMGRARVEVEDPESQASYIAVSRLSIFAGRSRRSTTTLLFRFEPLAPSKIPLLVVAKARVIERGRFGMSMSIALPRFAGGNGSIVSLGFGLRRRAPGGRAGVMAASCPDGHLNFRFTGDFADGSKIVGSAIRVCTEAA